MTPKDEMLAGCGLVTWGAAAEAMREVSLVATTIMYVCGAILGAHGVWKMYCNWRTKI